MTQVASAERISNTRCLAARQAEWMANAQGADFPPELRFWPLQGQKQTKVLRIGFLPPACPEAGGKGSDRQMISLNELVCTAGLTS